MGRPSGNDGDAFAGPRARAGCHRVGYDQTRPMGRGGPARVARLGRAETMSLQSDSPVSQVVFKHLWLGELSEETIAAYHPFSVGRLSPTRTSASRKPTRARTSIALARARGLAADGAVQTTRCLGNVVRDRASPVAHWSAVSQPGPSGSGTGAATRATNPSHRGAMRRTPT